MRALKTCTAVLLFALVACGGGDQAVPTEVAVKNGGSASIDATISDGKAKLVFNAVAAGTTSSFKTASFASLSALTVTVQTQTSSADISEGMRNVVTIGADGKVEGVITELAPTSSGGSAW
jgi:hypothetical protein